MKLKKLRIENFRGYKDVTIDFNDFNCIVGKNDVGKSTIFKALEKFFDYRSDIDENDYNGVISNDKNEIYAQDFCPVVLTATIECKDSSLQPFAVNDNITVQKRYEISPRSLKYKYHFGIIVNNSFFGDGGLTAVYSEKTKNLKAPFGIKNTNYSLKPDKGNVKKIGDDFILIPTDMISSFNLDMLFEPFPKFKMLSSSTSVTEYTQMYIETLMATEIEEFSQKINNKLSPEFKRLLVSSERFSQSSNDDEVEIDEPRISINGNLMTNIGTKKIPLSNRGEGFQLNVRNAIFRHLTTLNNSERIILAFEEPEAHLHPSAERELYGLLKNLSKNSNYQVLITTHSPTIVSECVPEELIQVQRNEDLTTIKQGSDNVIKDIVEDLGITANSELISALGFADCYAFVEGKHDIPLFKHLLKLYGKNDDIKIAYIPMGSGDNVNLWVNLKLVDDLKKPYLFVIDSDNKEKTIKNLADKNYHILSRREFENYIKPECLEKVSALSLPPDCLQKYSTVWNKVDVPLVCFVEKNGLTMPKIEYNVEEVRDKANADTTFLTKFREKVKNPPNAMVSSDAVKSRSDKLKSQLHKYLFEEGNAKLEDLDFKYKDSAGAEHDEFEDIYNKIKDLCK